ncbi:Predicted branched-chain amino acid permease (azaleucine resistance) [Micromonospora echinaurantiaca]|uniref:Predicted branched-chain amino acid permease (Azaleucine resistance) n=1 Tax=Micromonospora echinaurantiaca TaxID=47857 RepID=A0A1C5IG35_9ACTN|nr:AzlC family ABC transporter permease [Micromonospora echinaurantiaca]SCG57367.1 Predicted branched-chain amino acid permease (azaleucine resistance) [Micromonospora echinaurantiaca]
MSAKARVRERGRPHGWRGGVRIGSGLAVAAFALAVSFGAAAVTEGWPAWLVVLMSAVVFAGGAQFALVIAFSGGGGTMAALGAATLINLRFVPMAVTASRSLIGGRWVRSVHAQAVVDGSWAAAHRPDGSVDRELMIAASLMQWPAWVAGTAIGAYLTPGPDLAHALGLDTIFPAFFLVFVLDSLRDEPRHRSTVFLAALIAAMMCWFVPPGIALLCAGIASLLALRETRRRA